MITRWLTPPTPIRGLDHLSVQAPCVALYTELLPGITNVTDRARYFTFHPWFVWAFEKRYASDRSEAAYARELRRAECLVTLVAIRHRVVTSGVAEVHDVAATGNRALGGAYERTVASGSVPLDDYAAFEGETRYFKARWGGLGQYYFGSLQDLRLLGYAKDSKPLQPAYGEVLGLAAAKAFDATVPADRFFSVLASGVVTADDLDALAPFCLCRVRDNDAERELLVDLFFARRPDAVDEGRETRRDSLCLLLDVVRTARPEDIVWTLRGAAYGGCLPAGAPWQVPAPLARAKRAWGVYQRNELLSMAVQGLFWAILQAMHARRRGSLRNIAEAGDVLVELARKTEWGGGLRERLGDVVTVAARELPEIGEWEDERHEHERARAAEAVAGRFDAPEEGVEQTVAHCIAVLIALLARASNDEPSPYSEFDLPPDRFGGDEIDLVSFRREAPGWKSLTLEAWVRWIAENWCVRRHLHVALRKLRVDGRDTFRIRPLDDCLKLVEVAPASFTGPRINKAQQILLDLGLIVRDENDGRLTVTPRGLRQLEAVGG